MRLPRAQRNDVAFELRALLHEELQGKAEDAGRAVDAAMALEFLRAFGRPADVAARYRPTLTIIDPSDGRRFLFATIVGLALIWSLGLLAQWRDAAEHGLLPIASPDLSDAHVSRGKLLTASSPYRKQSVVWSFTSPTACMKA